MSKYDGPIEPDYDRYETRPVDDVDVPDFDAPDTGALPADPGNGQTGRTLTTSGWSSMIDPAEHAMHALVDALATLDQQIATAPTLERANLLRKMLKRAWADVTRVTDHAGDQVDRFVEKLR